MKKTVLFLLTGLLLGACKPDEIKVINVTGVLLDSTAITLVEGASQLLTADVQPENADIKKVSWKSSDTNVATVSYDGWEIGVSGVKLDPTAITLNEGASQQLSASVKRKLPPEHGEHAGLGEHP